MLWSMVCEMVMIITGLVLVAGFVPKFGAIRMNYAPPEYYVEVGKILRVNCTAGDYLVQSPGYDVNRIYLKVGGVRMIDTTVVSKDTISYAMKISLDSPKLYTCYYNETISLGDISIRIGGPPPVPELKKFIIHSWSWIEFIVGPSREEIKKITGKNFIPKITVRHNAEQCNECTTDQNRINKKCENVENLNIASWRTPDCNETKSDSPCLQYKVDPYNDYIRSNDSYFIYVKFENDFGSRCHLFRRSKEGSTQPDPAKIKPIQVEGSRSVEIKLVEPKNCKDRGCVYYLNFTAKNFDHSFTHRSTKPNNQIDGLYPHGEYTVVVTARPPSYGLESESEQDTFTMWEDVPAANPAFIPGAIEAFPQGDDQQDLKLYWQEVPEREKNGLITWQKIDANEANVSVAERNITKDDLEQTSFKFRASRDKNYVVTLRAGTKKGANASLLPSTLHIEQEKGDLCIMKNVVAVRLDNEKVNVSWDDSECQLPVDHTAVYICRKKMDDNACKDQLTVFEVPANASNAVINRTFSSDEHDRIAVAYIPSSSSSSRMLFSPCVFKRGAEPEQGTLGHFKQEDENIAYMLDNYICKEMAGVVKELLFHICASNEDGNCSDDVITQTLPMPSNYMYEETTFTLKVPRSSRWYSARVTARSDGGKQLWQNQVVEMKSLSGSSLEVLYALILIPVVAIVLFVVLCVRHLRKKIHHPVQVTVPPVTTSTGDFVYQGNDHEPTYDEVGTTEDQRDDVPIVRNGRIPNGVIPNGHCRVPHEEEIVMCDKKRHPSLEVKDTSAETSLTDHILVDIDDSSAETSGMGGSSGINYAKVTLKNDEDTPEEVSVHPKVGKTPSGYAKLHKNPSESVPHDYESLRTLPVLRDRFPVPENKLSPVIERDKTRKNSKDPLCILGTVKEIENCDSGVNSSESCENSGDQNYKRMIPKMDSDDDLDTTGGSVDFVPGSTDFTSSGMSTTDSEPSKFCFENKIMPKDEVNSLGSGDCTSGNLSSGQEGSANHDYREPDSNCSYESTSGSLGEDASNHDYRGACTSGVKSAEVFGKQFKGMHSSEESISEGATTESQA